MSKVVYVFIDASNLWEVQKAKGRFIDFNALKNFLKKKYSATTLQVFYYTAYPKEGTREYSIDNKHKFYTYLKKALNFMVRKKPLKQIRVVTEAGEGIEEKGNMDVELTIDVVNFVKKYDIAVLFTGDSDFLALINYIRNRGKKTYVFSSRNNISTELRTGGDGYTDILNITKNIWRGEIQHRKD